MSNGDLTNQNKALRRRAYNQRKEIQTLTKRLEFTQELNKNAYLVGFSHGKEVYNMEQDLDD